MMGFLQVVLHVVEIGLIAQPVVLCMMINRNISSLQEYFNSHL
jgi:hypothetical protein